MDQTGRQSLPHERPLWLSGGQTYFITMGAEFRGQNILANDDVAPALIDSFRWRHEQARWHGLIFLVMPDHVHALLMENPGRPIAKEILDWKKFTARKLHICWQRDFFEHRLRHDESRHQRYDYILENPLRAGLVFSKRVGWPYVWKESTDGWGQPSLPA